MTDGICFAGLDVHARKTAAAAVQLGSGEVFTAQLSGSPGTAIEWLGGARAAGIEVIVCSPGAIPREPRDRIKTNMDEELGARWALESASGGTTPDSSGNGLTAGEVAGSFAAGRFGNALSTPGNNDGAGTVS